MSLKKIFAAVLALTMLVVFVAGCSSSDDPSSTAESQTDAVNADVDDTGDTGDAGDYPTISLMVLCGSTPTDSDMVAQALSEITREKIGVM